jgi:hypothetical protein
VPVLVKQLQFGVLPLGPLGLKGRLNLVYRPLAMGCSSHKRQAGTRAPSARYDHLSSTGKPYCTHLVHRAYTERRAAQVRRTYSVVTSMLPHPGSLNQTSQHSSLTGPLRHTPSLGLQFCRYSSLPRFRRILPETRNTSHPSPRRLSTRDSTRPSVFNLCWSTSYRKALKFFGLLVWQRFCNIMRRGPPLFVVVAALLLILCVSLVPLVQGKHLAT